MGEEPGDVMRLGHSLARHDAGRVLAQGQADHPRAGLPGPDAGELRHVSKRFKKLAEEAGVPVITLHEGGRHTGNSLMQDAGVDQELRMREVGHAGKSVNDRYTHPLEKAHIAAAELTAALVRRARSAA